jgi:hypothetical protein
VQISIHNVLGEQVGILQEGYVGAGYHRVNFNAGEFSSGLYLVKMDCPGDKFTDIKKVILVK